jgi:hypothetical protein
METYLEELLENELLEYMTDDFIDNEDLLDELVEV